MSARSCRASATLVRLRRGFYPGSLQERCSADLRAGVRPSRLPSGIASRPIFSHQRDSRLLAEQEPTLLRIIMVWVIVIRRPSRTPNIQFSRVGRKDRSTLAGNSDKRSVIVHATPLLAWVNGTGTSGHLKEQECCSDHKCKGHFHWKSSCTCTS